MYFLRTVLQYPGYYYYALRINILPPMRYLLRTLYVHCTPNRRTEKYRRYRG